MSIELTLLVWSVGLTFVQMLVYAAGASHLFGLAKLAGNREDLPSAAGWVGRAGRAHRNMLENLLLFAILVLVAEITDKNDAMTGLGAQLFFWGRLAYAIIYVAGIAWARTTVWIVSTVGLILIFVRLI
jgi:uncharacterized MAPEG superfamily protein